MEICDISLNSARCLVGSQRGLLPKICLQVSESVWLVTATVELQPISHQECQNLGGGKLATEGLTDFPLIAP